MNLTLIYNTVLYNPIFNALMYLYTILPWRDMGLVIILLTIIIKLILFWPSLAGLKSQKKLQDTQPKIDAIRAKYKDDKEELGKQLMAFYKDNKVNPFSSCLPLLIQLPILIALYHSFFYGLQIDPTTHLLAANQIANLYAPLRAIYTTTPINTMMFGIVNLSATHNIVLAVAAGLAAFYQAKTLQTKAIPVKTKDTKDENAAVAINKQMMYLLPVMTVIFGYQFPAGVTLYWLVSTLFSLVQQLYFLRVKKQLDASNTTIIDVSHG